MTIDEIKAQAKILKEFLKNNEVEITHSSCLEVISKMNGFKDWNHMSAFLKTNQENNNV